MKKTVFTALIFALAGAAGAADFTDLAVNAASLKASAAQKTFDVTPEISDILAASAKDGRWYGKDSRQARMQFNSYMHYRVPANYTGAVAQILNNSYHKQKISELVDLQLQHMYGAFTMHPGFVDNPGIPSGDYKVTLLGAEKVPNEPYARISYSYEDLAVFSSRLFRGSGAARINFALPKDPVTVYSKGFPSPSSRLNRCTDSHYNSEGDFWYFWNPYQDGCPLTGADLVGVTTDLRPVDMTRNTYPEYARLYGENGNGDVLQVSYLVGVDENFQSGDLGKKTFNDAFAGLKRAGFRATVDEPRRKQLTFNAGAKRTHVQMLLTDPDSAEFAVEAVRAMKKSDIFLYDGHSGLGGYLNPERLTEDSGRPLTLPKDKYQIFVFQGCSTYAYYNSAYFRLKKGPGDPKGTKNLDIITTGIGAAFDVGAAVDASFLVSVTTGQRPSWQTIIDRMSAAEGDNSALTHINGDEDNPRAP
ncbi:MAG: hypothetical protein A2X31_00750 [Elusimicrobia bacterium GWB2_63_22]|nr:MAG: hypothetical protein A2X31_00750 [Elusimicrobia bacterium GWB2_63_22]